ncbi:class E sortase [Streptomyces sp. NPDC051180]|uniref:class E sortase n=1 Tax=Streptomyces sp. NPDC051180 TaxID=3155797 RepID=UPI00344BF241
MTTGSPWFRASDAPEPEPIPADPYGYAQPSPYEPEQPYAPGPEASYPADPAATYPVEPGSSYPAGTEAAYTPGYPTTAEQPYAPASPYPSGSAHEPQPAHAYEPQPAHAYEPQPTHTYEAQPAPQPAPPYEAETESPYESAHEAPYTPVDEPYGADEAPVPPRDETVALRALETPPGPGRAERRKAAAKGGRGGRRGTASGAPARRPAEDRPLSRVEARRAARAAKDSVGVVASRAVGELFITLGVVMLLFVTYQLWWTNVLAGQETDKAKERIEDTWAHDTDKPDDSKPAAFEPGEGFAIMYIPKLDVVVPIAEGISKSKVLDKGMVGHYGEGKLKTAMPSDKQGNFAVAGHRNTHGEPFRYINRLKPGDPIVVETRNAYYTYEMASILPQTSPSNVSVIDAVPKGSGFTGPGRFITLTTCTPEFTSTYRMIVWGKLVEERPRSKGKPQALVG